MAKVTKRSKERAVELRCRTSESLREHIKETANKVGMNQQDYSLLLNLRDVNAVNSRDLEVERKIVMSSENKELMEKFKQFLQRHEESLQRQAELEEVYAKSKRLNDVNFNEVVDKADEAFNGKE